MAEWDWTRSLLLVGRNAKQNFEKCPVKIANWRNWYDRNSRYTGSGCKSLVTNDRLSTAIGPSNLILMAELASRDSYGCKATRTLQTFVSNELNNWKLTKMTCCLRLSTSSSETVGGMWTDSIRLALVVWWNKSLLGCEQIELQNKNGKFRWAINFCKTK